VVPREIGTVDLEDGLVNLTEEVWPDGMPPPDGTPYTALHYPYTWIVISSNILAGITIVVAVVCMLFTVAFRERK